MTAKPLGGLAAIPFNEIHPSPNNPRERLKDIDELAASIEEVGLIQPIVVQKVPGQAGYQIVAGHRRYAAVMRLKWSDAPCIIRRDLLPDEELVTMLVENGQRAGLDPIEEARAINRMVFDMRFTKGQVAEKIGRSAAYVGDRLLLLSLPVDEQEKLRAGVDTIGVAKAKARLATGRLGTGKRSKNPGWHFSFTHDLGKHAEARCRKLGHSKKRRVSGGIACGACWETVIRADERQQLHNQSDERGRCVLCDVTHDPDRKEDAA